SAEHRTLMQLAVGSATAAEAAPAGSYAQLTRGAVPTYSSFTHEPRRRLLETRPATLQLKGRSPHFRGAIPSARCGVAVTPVHPSARSWARGGAPARTGVSQLSPAVFRRIANVDTRGRTHRAKTRPALGQQFGRANSRRPRGGVCADGGNGAGGSPRGGGHRARARSAQAQTVYPAPPGGWHHQTKPSGAG